MGWNQELVFFRTTCEAQVFKNEAGASSGAPAQDHFTYETGPEIVLLGRQFFGYHPPPTPSPGKDNGEDLKGFKA